MQCPKCGHERSIQDDELTPKSDCPSCGIIYAKFKKKISAQKVSKQNLTESQVDNNSPEDEPVKFSYKYSGIAAFLIFCLFIYGAYSENTNKYNSTTSISNNSYVSHLPISSAAKWYENGTLHRANIQQWNRATFANQLATSADMAISHSKEIGRAHV